MNLKEYVNKVLKSKTYRAKQFALFGMIFNFIWSVIQIVLGVYFFSLYFIITGAYTLLLGFSKRIFMVHHSKDNKEVKTQKGLIIISFILIVSILYTVNMSSLFLTHEPFKYHLILSIAIAAFSFTELTLGIINFVKAKKSNNPLLISYRTGSLVSSMFAIVTTQIALLAATDTTAYMYNALTGTIFGSFSIAISVMVLISIHKNKKQSNLYEIKKDLE